MFFVGEIVRPSGKGRTVDGKVVTFYDDDKESS